MNTIINLAYIVACICSIMGIKKLNKPGSARQGMIIAALGTLIGVVAVFFEDQISVGGFYENGFFWCFIAIVIGSVIGFIWSKKVKMTGMPELVALYNGFGGLASALVAFSQFWKDPDGDSTIAAIAVCVTIFIGALAFTGSMLAWGKLSEKITGRAIVFKGQNAINLILVLAVVAASVIYVVPGIDSGVKLIAVLALSGISLIFGITFVLPIGGGDMPVVISLINSATGLAVAAAGFIIENTVLIVSGALVGASGMILTLIMCKAMNRSIGNLLFSGFGATDTASGKGPQAEPKSISVEDAYPVLEAAGSVVFIPGYGMAVAQAQHVVKELAEKLEANGTEVNFAVHPVAGRMPGHMNVLLAEVDVPYEQLHEMDEINPAFADCDVCVIIGANDVVNPAANTAEGTPIYGMPVLDVERARHIILCNYDTKPGYSGVDNPLYTKEEGVTLLLGDASVTVTDLVERMGT